MEKEELPKWYEVILQLHEQARTCKKSDYFSLNDLAIKRLAECKNKNGIIAFPNVWEKLCRSFSIKKEDCWKLLRYFRDIGKIEIVPYRGVRIKNGSSL